MNDQWIADATTEICALRRKTGIAFDDEIAHIIASHLPSPPEPGQGAKEAADLRMDAYYYGFDPTGVYAIDLILSAVACAGKAYHHTQDWGEDCQWEPHTGDCPSDWIENAAKEAAKFIAAHTIEPSEHERVVGQRDGLLVFAEFCERLEAKLARCSDLAHGAWQHGFDAESIGDKDFCDQLAVISCETENEVADAEYQKAENERLRLEVIGQTAARRAFQQILSDHTTQCGPCTDAIHKAMNIAEQAREGGES